MKLHNLTAQIFVRNSKPVRWALQRITQLGRGAHQNDLDFMVFHHILECFAGDVNWFGGVTCTNGGGSPGRGAYEKFSDAQLMAVRRRGQNNAAGRRMPINLAFASDVLNLPPSGKMARPSPPNSCNARPTHKTDAPPSSPAGLRASAIFSRKII
jgi:hypothetical protein